ncbi:MAG: 2-dehydropantoate 2-reductase [Gemmatimonadaceae bacterium]|nr:2-dehydropantoate 2-reductase [Acetobacteraceae bacterium]
MRVCVFGAGAIGTHVAGRLAKGGAEVGVIARGTQLAAFRDRGLRVVAADGEIATSVAASADPHDLGPQDMVIVTVKAPALPSVAASIAPLLGPETAVAYFMNGIPYWYFQGIGDARLPLLDPGGAIWDAVAPARVIGGVVYSACTITEPGVVHVENPTSRIVVGEPDGRLSGRIEALAAILRAGGLVMDVTPRIRDTIWAKLLLNLGTGPLAVLTGGAPRRFFAEPACHEATQRILDEGAAIAAAMGCPAAADAVGQIDRVRTSRHKSSILQDLEHGRPMEIDALYTVPLAFARTHGIPTPTLDLLVAMVRARAREAGLYPD